MHTSNKFYAFIKKLNFMLSKFNFFGYIPELYVHGGLIKTVSNVNSFFSMFFAGIFLWTFIVNSQIMLRKESPLTIKSDDFQIDPEMIPISPET
jgi:hypothetical protein